MVRSSINNCQNVVITHDWVVNHHHKYMTLPHCGSLDLKGIFLTFLCIALGQIVMTLLCNISQFAREVFILDDYVYTLHVHFIFYRPGMWHEYTHIHCPPPPTWKFYVLLNSDCIKLVFSFISCKYLTIISSVGSLSSWFQVDPVIRITENEGSSLATECCHNVWWKITIL